MEETSAITAKDLQSGLDCYIHNVSPVKSNDKKKQWFDCTLQTPKGQIRGVCFDPSPGDVDKFTKASVSKSPVKLKKVRLGTKRAGFPVDVIIDKKVILEDMDPSPTFLREQIDPSAMKTTIGNLSSMKPGQLLTIKAYVNCLTAPKTVTQKSTQEDVQVAECQLTDSTGSIKLVLWGRFVSKIENGQTYEFVNLRLKTNQSKLHLSTTQVGCVITAALPLENINPPKELPDSVRTDIFSIKCVTRISSYTTCNNCSKKLVIAEERNIVTCESCHATMNKRRCKKAFYAKVQVSNQTHDSLPLTMFDNAIKQIVTIFNTRNPKRALAEDQLSEENILEAMLELDHFKISYDNSKVVNVAM